MSDRVISRASKLPTSAASRAGHDFEIGLGDELAHARSAEVDRLVRELSGEDGINEVLREDRDIILVRAPLWRIDALETWISRRV